MMDIFVMKEVEQDPALEQYTLNKLELLDRLKKQYLNTPTSVCIERSRYLTQYMKSVEGKNEPIIITRAKAINYYLSNREALFHDDNLIAGSTTSKPLGAPVYPELMGISIWPELDDIGDRKANPELLKSDEAEILNFEVFPYWIDNTLMEVTRKKLLDEEKKLPSGEKHPVMEAFRLMEKIAFFMNGKSTVISHTVPYYEDALHKGLNAMIQEVEARKKMLSSEENDKADFYEAMQISMKGIINYASNLAKKARELAATASTPEKKTLYNEIAEVCSRVPANPATSFREAVNSLWLCHVGILAENVNMAMSPGRLDQVLYPFFKKDVEEKKITIEQALNIIGCLWFKIADNTNLVPASAEKLFGGAGSVPAVTLGGIDKERHNAVNDLTYMMLRVTELLLIKDPNVNARYHQGINSDMYRDRVAKVILNTKAVPAVYNDAVNIATLENQGVTPEHARDYAVVGCVELNSSGREYASTSSILFNLSAAMDLTIYNGKRPYIMGDEQIGPKTGEPKEFTTYEQFLDAFKKQLFFLLDRTIILNEEFGKMHQKLLPTPLLSCFFLGPLDKGKDLIFGGALYNSSGATHVAFADVCDSLNAIEDVVYNNKIFTMEQLVDAVKKNFSGYENLYAYLKNKAPKYGMHNQIAEGNSRWLIHTLYEYYQGKTNYRGGKYRPAYWTMTNHAGLGKIGKALPSGRKDFELFSSGITPASQMAKDLTAAYLSVAKLDSNNIPGGVALNMKYTPLSDSSQKEKYLNHFTSMIDGYFENGGMQVQYNIYTYDELKAARKNPSAYPGLVVRVSGYSAYFKDLNDAMKDELITRTQYDLFSNKAVPYPGDNEDE